MSAPGSRPARLSAACLLLALAADPAAADGAWSFESARKLYKVEKLRPEDVPVPQVVVDESFRLPRGVGQGPELEIKSYEVVGTTLIPPSEVQQIVKPYLGPGRYMSDIQAARDALQAAYEERGFPTVAVQLPKQTLLDGRVRIEVIEARLGAVHVDNPGIDWYSEGGVRKATPHLQSGALVRTEDLQSDLARANGPRDRRVTPVLKAGQQPGTVDLDLKVDDRIPLHGSVEWNNYHTPGTPRERVTARVSYENLWQLEHELAVQYTFVPEAERGVRRGAGVGAHLLRTEPLARRRPAVRLRRLVRHDEHPADQHLDQLPRQRLHHGRPLQPGAPAALRRLGLVPPRAGARRRLQVRRERAPAGREHDQDADPLPAVERRRTRAPWCAPTASPR